MPENSLARVSTALALTTAAQSFSTLAAYAVPIVAVQATLGYGLPPTAVGVFSAVMYISAMLIGLVAGDAIARFGAVRTAQAGLVSCGVGLLAVIATNSTTLAALGAFLIGVGVAPMNPLASYILARESSPENLPFVLSVKQTGTPIGGLLAGLVIPPLVAWYDWRVALMAVAVIPVVCAAALQPVRSGFDTDRSPSRRIGIGGVRQTLRVLKDSPPLLVLGGCAFLYTTAQLGVVTFMVPYLEQAHAMSKIAAGGIFAIVHASAIPGRILWGALAGRFILTWRLLASLGLVMAVSVSGFAFFDPRWPFIATTGLAIMMGLSMNGLLGLLLAEFARLAPSGKVGEATGGGQFFTYGGVFFGPILFGGLVAASGSYAVAILTAAVLAGLAAAILFFTVGLARRGPPEATGADS